MTGFPILSLLIAIPTLAAIACLFVDARTARWIALIATAIAVPKIGRTRVVTEMSFTAAAGPRWHPLAVAAVWG